MALTVDVFDRVVDMGIEPFLVASSLVGVVRQRLVRKICPSCAGPYEPSVEDRAIYAAMGSLEKITFVRAVVPAPSRQRRGCYRPPRARPTR